ncbi:hypothetical protein ACF0H5_012100 [Mactra antiquata]
MPRGTLQTLTNISSVILCISIIVILVLFATDETLNCSAKSNLDAERQNFIGETKLENTHTPSYKLKLMCLVTDRSKSLRRLLESLNKADFDQDKVTLAVWIDRDKNGTYDAATLATAKNFMFKHGNYFVNIHENHVGLQGQYLNTYNVDEAKDSEMVVFLEDDMTVSPFFYKYLKLVHSKYDSRPDINGYSLLGVRTKVLKRVIGMVEPPADQPVFKLQGLGTWGFSPNIPKWKEFLRWFEQQNKNPSFRPYPLDYHSTTWFQEIIQRNSADEMWSIWHTYYSLANKEYTIISNVPNYQGLATHWHDDVSQSHTLGTLRRNLNSQHREWDLNYNMLPNEPVVIELPREVDK